MPTHYETLNVPTTATPQQIKAAYKHLALANHPDKTHRLPPKEQTARSERFKSIISAYKILSDSLQRAIYDRTFSTTRRKKPIPTPREPASPVPAPAPRSRRQTDAYGRRNAVTLPLDPGPYMTPRGTYPTFPIPFAENTAWEHRHEGVHTHITIPQKFRVQGTPSLSGKWRQSTISFNIRRVFVRGTKLAPGAHGAPIRIRIENGAAAVNSVTVTLIEIRDAVQVVVDLRKEEGAGAADLRGHWEMDFDGEAEGVLVGEDYEKKVTVWLPRKGEAEHRCTRVVRRGGRGF